MSPLDRLLGKAITESGGISVADYMALCLTHPQYGYYTTRDPLGAAGDFITAPEISQMFGEMAGLWLAQAWQDQGSPSEFALVELGPGRGTLMADILRVAGGVPGFLQAARVCLVEVSPRLRAQQEARLRDFEPEWFDSFEATPELPTFLIANEFFDALPIRQFVRTEMGWQERLVGQDDSALGFVHSKPVISPDLDRRFPLLAEGRVVEICAAAESVAAGIGARLKALGGAALIFDYGAWHGVGDTLQAVLRHQPVDSLNHPHGQADLTAHVHFEPLALASGLRPHFFTQGGFLESLGITARAQRLAVADPAIEAQHRRLTHPEEMGTLFKVLALLPDAAPQPPGFEHDARHSDRS